MRLEKSFGWYTIEMPKVLVYGYYGKANLGDDLFVDAFKHLFPKYEFTFTDNIKISQLEGVDAVFFGGGSFLAESLKASDEVFQKLKTYKIFYIGVGGETALNPRHQELMSLAELVAVRTSQNIENISQVNSNYIVIPDLVYSLEATQSQNKLDKSILVIPNVLVVPKWNDPHWKHAAWEFFKIEFAQAIDQLLADKYRIDFLPFCQNNYLNDYYAAAEIVSRCNTISHKKLFNKPDNLQSAIDIISQYQLVVTQRYHGAILADLAGVSSLTIYHHDKLRGVRNTSIPYYGSSKNVLLDNIKNIISNSSEVLPIDRNIFRELQRRVDHALCRSQE